MKTNPNSQSGIFNPRALLAFALCSVGLFLAALGFATTPTPAGWSVVSSPNANVPQMFNDIACTSANDCWAVGSRYDSWHFQDVTLVEHWNGTSWSIVNSPNQGDADVPVETSVLSAVTCASASDCWAVGYYYGHVNEQPLIEHWDGTSWSIATSPGTGAGALLKSVTCVSASNCWAVGYYDSTHSVAAGPNQTLTEQWDGTAWVIVPSANAGTAQNNQLTGVTCSSASDCWAVGYYDSGSVNQTLIERWNGTLWAVVASPDTASTQNNQFNAITCLTSSDCWTAGNFNIDQPLTAHWNGTAWAIVSSPAALGGALLKSVACSSASECWAVGQVSNADQPFMQQWNGASWGIVGSPVASSSLNGITCLSGGNCWTAGYQISIGGFKSTLAQRWTGTSWSAVASPNVIQPTLSNHLQGVACATASDCWAVGRYESQALTEHWDGASWTVISSASGDAGGYYLNGVACAGPSDCWAVGNHSDQTLIQHWNGTAWSIVGSPEAGQGNYLAAVTCTSASNCWAVGDYGDGAGNVYTLIKRWNGTSWSIVNSPSVGTGGNYLGGVACSSASNCWAVGSWSYYDAESEQQFSGPIIERWDGTSWTIVPAPAISEPNPTLASVACPSATACWAVGAYESGFEEVQTLILRWNGTSWNVESSPVFGSSSWLASVACPSPYECWGVGQALDTTGHTLIEQWDGNSWQVASSSLANGTSFSGVACASGPECWAVGTGVLDRTLIEVYTATIPPLASVVSRKVHGNAGTFDIDLPLTGTRGIECRSGGANGTYQMIFSLVNNVTSCGTASTGSLSSGPGSNQCTVNLTGVTNQQNLTVTLSNVLDAQNNTGNVSATMGVLIGDTNADGFVNSADIGQTKSRSGQTVGSTNFRSDVTVDGNLNSGDIGLVKSKSGTALP